MRDLLPPALGIKRLSREGWLLREQEANDWVQVPTWPCSEATLRANARPEVSETFLREVIAASALVGPQPCDNCGRAPEQHRGVLRWCQVTDADGHDQRYKRVTFDPPTPEKNL